MDPSNFFAGLKAAAHVKQVEALQTVAKTQEYKQELLERIHEYILITPHIKKEAETNGTVQLLVGVFPRSRRESEYHHICPPEILSYEQLDEINTSIWRELNPIKVEYTTGRNHMRTGLEITLIDCAQTCSFTKSGAVTYRTCKIAKDGQVDYNPKLHQLGVTPCQDILYQYEKTFLDTTKDKVAKYLAMFREKLSYLQSRLAEDYAKGKTCILRIQINELRFVRPLNPNVALHCHVVQDDPIISGKTPLDMVAAAQMIAGLKTMMKMEPSCYYEYYISGYKNSEHGFTEELTNVNVKEVKPMAIDFIFHHDSNPNGEVYAKKEQPKGWH